MPVAKWEGKLISAEEFDQLENLYRPLAPVVRELIGATVRTGAGEENIRAAAEANQAVTDMLKALSSHGWQAIRHADAHIDRLQEHKTYTRGFISDGQGPTVEAEAVFITAARTRESGLQTVTNG